MGGVGMQANICLPSLRGRYSNHQVKTYANLKWLARVLDLLWSIIPSFMSIVRIGGEIKQSHSLIRKKHWNDVVRGAVTIIDIF
jgi:hypothetical protein